MAYLPTQQKQNAWRHFLNILKIKIKKKHQPALLVFMSLGQNILIDVLI